MWHSVAQFPVIHVTMLQFHLKLRLIMDGSGTECKSYCHKDKYNLEYNPELCYLSSKKFYDFPSVISEFNVTFFLLKSK